MALYENLEPALSLARFRGVLQNFSDVLIRQVSESTVNTDCSDGEADVCRNDADAFRLKLVAIVVILTTSVLGIAIPLVGRKRRFLRTDSSVFVLIKAFAAGVILATGFVHMLPDGQDALTNPCLPSWPWSEFPFPGFIAMMASLGTLVLDFLGTQFYMRKHRKERGEPKAAAAPVAETDEERRMGISSATEVEVEEVAATARRRQPCCLNAVLPNPAATPPADCRRRPPRSSRPLLPGSSREPREAGDAGGGLRGRAPRMRVSEDFW